MVEFKEIKESKLFVRRIVEEGIDNNGNKYIKSRWFEQIKPLNLGSLSKPKNEDVIEFRFETPKKILENFF